MRQRQPQQHEGAGGGGGIRIVRRQARDGEPELDSLVLFRGGLNFAKRHYGLTLFYILGLAMLQFATGFAVPQAQQEEFRQVLGQIDIRAMDQAKHAAEVAYDDYRASKGWFFTCDDECHRLYALSQQANKLVTQHQLAYEQAVSDARSRVGVFSEYAVSDARDTWWSAFDSGVSFAKRMSYYDAFSLAIGSMRKDDSLLSIVVQFLFQALINFSVGLVTALVSFVVHVVQLVFSYQAHPVTGVAFVLMATSGAFAVVASFVVGAYAVAATATFVGIKAMGNARIEFEPRGDHEPRRNLRD